MSKVTDTTSELDPIEALYIESPSIGLVEFRKRIEQLIDKVQTEARIDEWKRMPDDNKPDWVINYKQLRIAELNQSKDER